VHHIVGYLSESVQFKIAEAAQTAREAARQGHSKRFIFCAGTPHNNGTHDVHSSRYFLFFLLKKKTTQKSVAVENSEAAKNTRKEKCSERTMR
jgi:hypothetical protein